MELCFFVYCLFYEMETGWIGFLLKFRWIAVLLVVLPLSKLMSIYSNFRQWYFDKFLSAPEEHDKRVRDIQQRVKEWISKGRPGGQLCTARPQWQRVQMRIGTIGTCQSLSLGYCSANILTCVDPLYRHIPKQEECHSHEPV